MLNNPYNVENILIDLDGVTIDDKKMFQQLCPKLNIEDHLTTLEMLGKKEEFIFPLIQEAIKYKLFEKAEPTLFLTALKDILIPSWKELGITVEILSSTMRTNPLRSELEQQKINWCNKYLPDLKLNLVEGSALKQDYAKPNTLLIDDFNRTIKQFIIKGGYALHYTSLNTTMKKLRLLGLSPP